MFYCLQQLLFTNYLNLLFYLMSFYTFIFKLVITCGNFACDSVITTYLRSNKGKRMFYASKSLFVKLCNILKWVEMCVSIRVSVYVVVYVVCLIYIIYICTVHTYIQQLVHSLRAII